MNIISKHLNRVLPRNWGAVIKDPRRCCRRWRFSTVMRTVVEALAGGCGNLRELEFLTANRGERLPDTTAWDLLVQLQPKTLNQVIAQGVKQASRSHELDHAELPVRLTVIDGKSILIRKYRVNKYSKNRSQRGCKKYVTTALRAFHASSSLKLLMGQQLVRRRTNESGTFASFLDELSELYGRTGLLEVLSLDAGFTSKKNAQCVLAKGLHYIMALKDERVRKATKVAKEILSAKKPVCTEEEVVNGQKITRSLYRCSVPELNGWEGARELWRVAKEVVVLRTGKTQQEDRYYISSLPPSKLTNKQVLKTIRLHWSIENNANWVMDTAWKEDNSPWCAKAAEVVSLLRIIAFNAVSRLKYRRFRRARLYNYTWKQVIEIVRTTLFPAKYFAPVLA